MRIQKIDSNRTSFGYNVVLNRKLIEITQSAKKNKAYYNFVENLCKLINKNEKDLRDAEKKAMPYLYSMLITTFIPIKLFFTDMVDSMFPELGYRQKEIDAYSEEIKERNLEETNPNHWMNALVDTMKQQETQAQANQKAQDMVTALNNFLKANFPGEHINKIEMGNNVYHAYEEPDLEEELMEEEDSKESDKKFDDKKDLIYVPKTEEEKQGFSSLGGIDKLKKDLMKYVVIPLKNIEKARYNEEHYGIKMPNGMLFYGPPGCGKTTLIERLSVEADTPLIEITRGTIASHWVDGSTELIKSIFDYAESIATKEKPIILFIDDIDLVVGSRDNHYMLESQKGELSEFFKRIQDASKNNIIVVAATNHYDSMDTALRERLRNQYYVGLPDKETRHNIIKMKLDKLDNGKKLALNEEALNKIVDLTDGYSIRSLEIIIENVMKEAYIDIDTFRDIELKDFENEIANGKASKTKEDYFKPKTERPKVGFSK